MNLLLACRRPSKKWLSEALSSLYVLSQWSAGTLPVQHHAQLRSVHRYSLERLWQQQPSQLPWPLAQ